MARRERVTATKTANIEDYLIDLPVAENANPSGGEEPGFWSKLGNSGLAILEGLTMLPGGVYDTIQDTFRGGDIDVTDVPDLNAREARDREKEAYLRKYDGKTFDGVADAMVSAPYSFTTMGASIAGGALGSPAGPAGVIAAGMAASGAVAYRATRDDFMQRLLTMTRDTLGRMPTQEEWNNVAAEFDGEATRYGAWEAIPEAIGNALMIKFFGPVGKKMGLWEGAKAYMKSMGSEQAQETVTQYKQGGIDAEMGWRERAPNLLEAFQEQAPVTFWQTTLMGGGKKIADYAWRKATKSENLNEEFPQDAPLDLLSPQNPDAYISLPVNNEAAAGLPGGYRNMSVPGNMDAGMNFTVPGGHMESGLNLSFPVNNDSPGMMINPNLDEYLSTAVNMADAGMHLSAPGKGLDTGLNFSLPSNDRNLAAGTGDWNISVSGDGMAQGLAGIEEAQETAINPVTIPPMSTERQLTDIQEAPRADTQMEAERLGVPAPEAVLPNPENGGTAPQIQAGPAIQENQAAWNEEAPARNNEAIFPDDPELNDLAEQWAKELEELENNNAGEERTGQRLAPEGEARPGQKELPGMEEAAAGAQETAPENSANTEIHIPGRERPEKAAYELVEADEIQPSHLPEAGFQKNPRYELENERRYHDEQASRDKVINNALALNPDFLLRDSVDANNGAPVIDRKNMVLGGNGRAMSIRLAYEKGSRKAEEYRDALARRCRELGIDPAIVGRMKKPALVRRLSGDYSREERQALVSALNDTFTDSKNAENEGKSRGDRLSRETLGLLATGLQEAESLRDFFNEEESRRTVESLIKDGVIMASERNRYVNADGLLNPDGKNFIEKALRGRIARNYETLASLPNDIAAKIDAITPYALIAENVGGAWNITENLRDAVDIFSRFKHSGFGKRREYENFLQIPDLQSGKTVTDEYEPLSVRLFLKLGKEKNSEVAKAFRQFASDATDLSPESGAFSLVQISAEDSLKKHFGVNMNESKAELSARLRGGTRAEPGKAVEEAGKEKAESQEDKYRKELPLVASVESGVIHKTESMTAIQAAIKWVQKHIISPIKTQAGLVEITSRGIKNSFSHGVYGDKLDAVQAIASVLEKGVYLDELPDKDGKRLNNHYFAARVKIGDTEKIVFIRTRKADGDSNRFYVHEVFTEEEISRSQDKRAREIDQVRYNGPRDFYKSLIARYQEVNEESGESEKPGSSAQEAESASKDAGVAGKAEEQPLENMTRAELVKEARALGALPQTLKQSKSAIIEWIKRQRVEMERKFIGKNASGDDVYVNGRGRRFARGRDGIERSFDNAPASRERDFMTVEELEEGKKENSREKQEKADRTETTDRVKAEQETPETAEGNRPIAAGDDLAAKTRTELLKEARELGAPSGLVKKTKPEIADWIRSARKRGERSPLGKNSDGKDVFINGQGRRIIRDAEGRQKDQPFKTSHEKKGENFSAGFADAEELYANPELREFLTKEELASFEKKDRAKEERKRESGENTEKAGVNSRATDQDQLFRDSADLNDNLAEENPEVNQTEKASEASAENDAEQEDREEGSRDGKMPSERQEASGENALAQSSGKAGNEVESAETKEDDNGKARNEQGEAGKNDKGRAGVQGSVTVPGAEGRRDAREGDTGEGGSGGRDLHSGGHANNGEDRQDGLSGEQVQGSDRESGNAQHDAAGGVERGSGVRDGLSGRGSERRGDAENPQDSVRGSGRTYLAPQGSLAREGSWRDTAERNLDIIELVRKLDSENREATPEEQALLAKYTGWGAAEIRNNLFPVAYNSDGIRPHLARGNWRPLVERALKLLNEKELAAALQSTQYAHYTSEQIIRSIWGALERMGFRGGKILEPGMGIGLFAIAGPQNIINSSTYTGVEMDPVTARIAHYLLPESNILNKDFIKQKFPDNFFDLAIGNPPFADIRITQDPAYKKYRFTLHDYFFAKALDKTRPGGLLVFVTSHGTMDKKSDKARQFMADRADLMGAIRLPQTAFRENAGTDVVTDVLFLKKREPGQEAAGEKWTGLGEVETAEGAALVNEYFARHPEMVLGQHSLKGSMYRGNEYTVLPAEGNIGEQFAIAAQNLPANVYSGQSEMAKTVRRQAIEHDLNPKANIEGSLYIDEKGDLRVLDNGVGVPVKLSQKSEKKDREWLNDYAGLKVALKQAQKDQLDNGDWEKSLKALNELYDTFVEKHGPLKAYEMKERKAKDEDGNPTVIEVKQYVNDRLLNNDVERSLVEQLEKEGSNGQIAKGPFLKGRTIGIRERGEIKSVKDALMVSLDETGGLDIGHVAKLAGKSQNEVIKDLGESIYKAPGGGWVMADEYLAGDVVTKLEEAEEAARHDSAYERNVKALLKVQPKPLGYADINVEIGANWVPVEYLNQFAKEKMGHYYGDDKISYNETSGAYHVPNSGARSESVNEYGTGDRTSYNLLDAVLNNRSVKVSRKDDITGRTEQDDKATALANEKMKKIREAFAEWIWQDAERAADLLRIYNRKFNNIAPRSFDGSHLTLPGLSLKYELYPHQKRAIWRIIQTGNTYLAHSVGAGKTLVMIVSGMEQKRLGLISRPLYIVPNHMLGQFASEFQQAYPLARIMVADDANFDRKKRNRFISQVALNAPDAVIMTHSSFGELDLRPENYEAINQRLMDELEEALEDSKKSGDRISRAKLEKRLESMKRRLEAKLAAKDEHVLHFEDLGVDFLYVDEAHQFRKLDFITNRANVKGISPEGSQRALDLYSKLEWLETINPGRSTVMASGTPVTNTMAELYSIMRYMHPQMLEQMGLNTFDAWATLFGRVQAQLEQNAAGNYAMVERFSRFVNLPELMSRVREFMDVLTMRQLGDYVQRPDLEGGAPRNIIVPASEELKAYQKELEKRLERAKNFRPSKEQPGNPDPILNIITDAKLAAIDMRFVDPGMPNDPGSKLNVMIDDIIRTHGEIADRVYRDPESGKEDAIRGGTQIVFSKDGFGENVAKNRGFDVKAWIMKRLKEAGIPASEVAWMRDYKKHAQKEAMFEDMRQGKIRILFGTPENMGTGVNVQKRLCKLHYLSAPWYPADVEQPHGRIIRQGNQNEKVEINWYATKGTYDSTTWGMISRKSRFIEQAFTGDATLRSMEDISETSQYEMAAAMAAGDERIIQLAGLNGDVERLTRLSQAHQQEQYSFIVRRRGLERRLEEMGSQRERLKKALEIAGTDKIGAHNFTASVQGRSYGKIGEAGEALIQAINDIRAEWSPHKSTASHEARLGHIKNADCRITAKIVYEPFSQNANKKVVREISLEIGEEKFNVLGEDKFEELGGQGLGSRLVNRLNSLESMIEKLNDEEKAAKRELEKTRRRIGEPFPQGSELAEKISELETLKEELRRDGVIENGKSETERLEEEIEAGSGIELDEGIAWQNGTVSRNEAQASIKPGEYLASRSGKARGMRKSVLEGLAAKLAKEAPGAAPTRVAQRFEELPENIRKIYRDKRDQLEGVYDPETGVVWLVGDNLDSAARASEVWAHEQLVHHGLRGLLGPAEMKRTLNSLWLAVGGMQNRMAREISQAYGLEPRSSESDRQLVMEEMLARMAERKGRELLDAREESVWRKIVNAISRAWHKLVDRLTGGRAGMGTKEMDALLGRLGEYVLGGTEARQAAAGNEARKAQKGAVNSYGVPLERVTVIERPFTREEAKKALAKLHGQDLPNLIEGVSAQVNSNQRDKLVSGTAMGKSRDNGFTEQNHFDLAAQIANAWKWAAAMKSEKDRKKRIGVFFDKYVAATRVDGKDSFALITVMNTLQGAKLYSVELLNEKELRLYAEPGNFDRSGTPVRSSEEIIKVLSSPVNENKQPLASLKWRDLLKMPGKKAADLADAPEIEGFFNKEDLGLLKHIFFLPHWIAKESAEFATIYERQLKRKDERAERVMESLEEVPLLFGKDRLGKEDMESLKDLVWKIEGRPFRFEKNGNVSKYVNDGQFPNGRVQIRTNPDFYVEYEKALAGMQATDRAKAAMLEIRKSLDNDLAAAYNRMASMTEASDDTITKFRDSIGRIYNYFPHHRYGQYYIQAIDQNGKVVFREHFDAMTLEQARRKAREIAAREKDNYTGATWKQGVNDKLPDEVLGAPIDPEAMEQIIRAATSRIGDRDQAEKVAKLLCHGTADILKSRGWASHAIGRKGVPGFEKEDIVRVLYDYKSGLYGWLTKMDASRDFSRALGDINARQKPRLWSYASQYIKDMLRNSDRVDRVTGNIKAVAFAWYLGANLKTAAVNATQNLIVGVPRLQMDAKGSGMLWLKSAMDAIGRSVTGNSGKNVTAEEQKMLEELYGQKIITDAFMNEVRGHMEGGKIAKAWNKFTDFLGLPMSVVERFNRASLALAAFRAARAGELKDHAKQKYGINDKASYEQAVEFATEVVRDAHFVYGKTNMPEFMRSNTAGRVASAMYTFRTFSHNMLNMWLWALKTQGREGAAFTAKSMGATMALGGMTALPFYATLMALFQLASGDDDDWTEEIRKALPDSDLLRDAVCYGLPALAGVNLGGSLKMETPVTRGLVRGSSPQEVLTHSIGDIIGIPYDLAVVRPTRIMAAAKEDNWWRALEEAMPTFIKNAMQSWRLYSEGQTSMKGKPINSPGERGARKLSAGEAVGKFLGFQPVSSTKSFDAHAAQQRREEVRSDAINRVVLKVLKAKDSGEGKYQREGMKMMQEWNARMKEEQKPFMMFNWKDVMRRVSARRRGNSQNAAAMEKGKRQKEVWGI